MVADYTQILIHATNNSTQTLEPLCGQALPPKSPPSGLTLLKSCDLPLPRVSGHAREAVVTNIFRIAEVPLQIRARTDDRNKADSRSGTPNSPSRVSRGYFDSHCCCSDVHCCQIFGLSTTQSPASLSPAALFGVTPYSTLSLAAGLHSTYPSQGPPSTLIRTIIGYLLHSRCLLSHRDHPSHPFFPSGTSRGF